MSRLPVPSWWLLYAAAGGYGLWQTMDAGGQHVPALCLIMAVLLMTLPMIVVHELGHFIAGSLLGLKMTEFSLGSGPILWQHTLRGLRLVLRRKPNCGHVRYLEEKETARFKHIIFIAGGPAANVLLAGLLVMAWDVRPAAFFQRPSLAAICTAANLWLALRTLNPVFTPGGVAVGSDGWQLWRLLQGKPLRLEVEELTLPRRRDTGLAHLQKTATHIQDMVQLAVYVSVGLLSLTLFLILVNAGVTTAALDVAMALIAIALLAWWILRLPWTSFTGRAARAAANPHADQTAAYTHAVGLQTGNWGLLELPEDVILELARISDDPASLPSLETLMAQWPRVRHLQLLKFDALLDTGKYEDAESVMQSVLAWDDLLPDVRVHFESCRLAAHVCAAPEEQGVAACDAALNEPLGEGCMMQRLHTLACTAAHSGRAELLHKAREWCERAHKIYPFDPATHTLMGIILMEQGDLVDARSWLLSSVDPEGNGSATVTVTACLALISAREGHPQAETLLRKSLKQDPPFQWKRRVEEALAAIHS